MQVFKMPQAASKKPENFLWFVSLTILALFGTGIGLIFFLFSIKEGFSIGIIWSIVMLFVGAVSIAYLIEKAE